MSDTADGRRPPGLEIHAVVTEAERPLVTASAQLLSECLAAATGVERRVAVTFWDAVPSDFLVPSAPALAEGLFRQRLVLDSRRDYRGFLDAGGPRIVVLSLLADVVQRALRHKRDEYRFIPLPGWTRHWTASQHEWVAGQFDEDPPLDVADAGGHWRSLIAELQRDGAGTSLFLCNVFRHVPGDVPYRYFGAPESLGERIRKFNLMAVDVSHATGVCVVDLDRALSHLGARRLGTDYRLEGAGAAAAGASALVEAIVWAGWDEDFTPAVQAQARAHCEARRAPVNGSPPASAPDEAPRYRPHLEPQRTGGRLQSFAPAGRLSLDWGFRRVLREMREGRIGGFQALELVWERVVKGVRRY